MGSQDFAREGSQNSARTVYASVLNFPSTDSLSMTHVSFYQEDWRKMKMNEPEGRNYGHKKTLKQVEAGCKRPEKRL